MVEKKKKLIIHLVRFLIILIIIVLLVIGYIHLRAWVGEMIYDDVPTIDYETANEYWK